MTPEQMIRDLIADKMMKLEKSIIENVPLLVELPFLDAMAVICATIEGTADSIRNGGDDG